VSSDSYIAIWKIYEGSDGAATKALYDRLTALGPAGVVAVNAFRANKCSARAKKYRGGNSKGRYRDQAYETKQWSINNLAKVCQQHAEPLGLRWGWKVDQAERGPHNQVFYLDLPTGQISFHTAPRGDGPNYPGEWDGVRGASPDRICRWVAKLLADAKVPA